MSGKYKKHLDALETLLEKGYNLLSDSEKNLLEEYMQNIPESRRSIEDQIKVLKNDN